MASSFEHTLRSLEVRARYRPWLIPALLLLGAWLVWLRCASVSVYASAPRARIEVSHAPSRVTSEAEGRLAQLNVQLGARIERGALLATLDPALARAALDERHAALAALTARRSGVEAQLLAERARRESRLRLAELAEAQAAVGMRRAEAELTQRRELARISEELQSERLNSRIDAVNAEAALRASHIAVQGAATEIERLAAERDYEERAERARLAELERQLGDLGAERLSAEAALRSAEARLDRLSIHAPISGSVGNVTPLQVGDLIQPGEVIASIVPSDPVRAVAHFPPGPSVGRILPGQPARLRLDGFSWTEFGMIAARVARVASEPSDGLIRVELNLDPSAGRWIPMQHGLTGSVDVSVEQASPWALLQRSLGRNLTRGESERSDAAPLARVAPAEPRAAHAPGARP